MKEAIWFILAMHVVGSAAQVDVFYNAPYGSKLGEYAHGWFGPTCGEACAAPRTFFVDRKTIAIDDCHSERTVLYDVGSDKHSSFSRERCYDIAHFDAEHMLVIAEHYMAVGRLTSGGELKWDKPFAKRPRDSFELFVEHPSGVGIGLTSKGKVFFDSTFVPVEPSVLPFAASESGITYIKEKAAMVTECFPCLRKELWLSYNRVTGRPRPDDRSQVLPLPDTTEWAEYFKPVRGTRNLNLLGIDTAFNTYWSAPRMSPEDPLHTYVAVFSYDKEGNLRFWFPEPVLDEEWNHYSGDIRVSRDGRIFQMIYYRLYKDPLGRHKRKNIDPTKGIRILEYIPEKHDFTHGGRVKHYGTGK